MSSYLSDYPVLQKLNQIRRDIRAQRRSLSTKQQLANSRAMIKILNRTSLFRYSRRIAIYIENDGELSVSQLIHLIRYIGKCCYLPVLRPMRPNRLWFSEYRKGDKLILNKYGIPEPDINMRKPVSPSSLDLVLVPLVAFDASCNRIGMGGGFYDRTFSYLRTRNKWRKPTLVGVAHELQRTDSIQKMPWDIQLNGIVTELKFLRVR